MSETENQILIRGDPDRVFELAAAVERWPEFLPHYRWVRVLAEEGDCRVVEMAARRGRIPIRWVSRQWRDPESRRIRFRHIGGLSRGMAVEWRIDPIPEGTRVVIWHGLGLEVPLVRTSVGVRIVAGFVKAVAGRTLACIKERVESEG